MCHRIVTVPCLTYFRVDKPQESKNVPDDVVTGQKTEEKLVKDQGAKVLV